MTADPLAIAFDALTDLGAECSEANAICALIDLYGSVDDFAHALADYRRMVCEADRNRQLTER